MRDTPTVLYSLPAELLLLIFSYFIPSLESTIGNTEYETNHGQLPLFSIRYTCRYFFSLSERLIENGHFYNHRSYLQLMNAKPELWAKVKSAVLQTHHSPTRDERFCSHLDAKLVLSKQHFRWPADEEFESDELEKDNRPGEPCREYNHERAALLALMPNLEELMFFSGPDEDNQRSRWGDNRVTCAFEPFHQLMEFRGSQHFQHLKSIRLDMRRLDVHDLEPIFDIPSMRQLSLFRDRKYRHGEPFSSDFSPVPRYHHFPVHQHCSNIHTLELQFIKYPHRIIERLIGFCKALISFTTEDVYTQRAREFVYDINTQPLRNFAYADILKYLSRKHQHTLQRLCIKETKAPVYDLADGSIIVTLNRFEKLQHLQIPCLFMVPADVWYNRHLNDKIQVPDDSWILQFPKQTQEVILQLYKANDNGLGKYALLAALDERCSPANPTRLEKLHIIEYRCPLAAGFKTLDLEALERKCKLHNVHFQYEIQFHGVNKDVLVKKVAPAILEQPNGEYMLDRTFYYEQLWQCDIPKKRILRMLVEQQRHMLLGPS
ncbi:unnamed protein product [Periconia digitata]|uniref:Uncharacterized protein n=1 Tax=Periconia digitata TaxID=1303443 RepID=A0A9W4UHI8_9PLEO|nr:unnamed protein product [Periconia digitata]